MRWPSSRTGSPSAAMRASSAGRSGPSPATTVSRSRSSPTQLAVRVEEQVETLLRREPGRRRRRARSPSGTPGRRARRTGRGAPRGAAGRATTARPVRRAPSWSIRSTRSAETPEHERAPPGDDPLERGVDDAGEGARRCRVVQRGDDGHPLRAVAEDRQGGGPQAVGVHEVGAARRAGRGRARLARREPGADGRTPRAAPRRWRPRAKAKWASTSGGQATTTWWPAPVSEPTRPRTWLPTPPALVPSTTSTLMPDPLRVVGPSRAGGPATSSRGRRSTARRPRRKRERPGPGADEHGLERSSIGRPRVTRSPAATASATATTSAPAVRPAPRVTAGPHVPRTRSTSARPDRVMPRVEDRPSRRSVTPGPCPPPTRSSGSSAATAPAQRGGERGVRRPPAHVDGAREQRGEPEPDEARGVGGEGAGQRGEGRGARGPVAPPGVEQREEGADGGSGGDEHAHRQRGQHEHGAQGPREGAGDVLPRARAGGQRREGARRDRDGEHGIRQEVDGWAYW